MRRLRSPATVIACLGYLAGCRALFGLDDPTVIDATAIDAAIDTAVDALVEEDPRRCTLAPGSMYTCALRHSDRSLWCVGVNNYGQLGHSIMDYQPHQVMLPRLRGAASGLHHTCAVLEENRVACWGRNVYGQLGDGTTVSRPTPMVLALTDVVEVETGADFTCVRRGSGAVMCWGNNVNGQLGDGTLDGKAMPLSPVELSQAAAITLALGAKHACALFPDATGECWGSNGSLQASDSESAGTSEPNPYPMPVTGIVQIAAYGNESSSSTYTDGHTCALLATGTIQCWGANSYGQLGNGMIASRSPPQDVLGLADAVEIVTGRYHGCARRASGEVVCWGSNDYFQLARQGENSTSPVIVSLPRPAIHLSAGGWHTCAQLDDYSVYCWGRNANGELGVGDTTQRTTPARSLICG